MNPHPALLADQFEAACDRANLSPEAAELATQILIIMRSGQGGRVPAALRGDCLAAIDQFEARLPYGLSTTAVDIAGGRQSAGADRVTNSQQEGGR